MSWCVFDELLWQEYDLLSRGFFIAGKKRNIFRRIHDSI